MTPYKSLRSYGTIRDSLDPLTSYEVTSEDGFIDAMQSNERWGNDVLSAMAPSEARWLAACLLEAADVAERHPRWQISPAKAKALLGA